MDADGNVLAAQRQRTVAGFRRTLDLVTRYTRLRDAGDPASAGDLLLVELELGRVGLDRARSRFQELDGLSEDQRARIEERLAALEMQSLLATAQRHFQAAQWKQASDVYGTITARDPDNAMAWFNLGYSLHAQGRLEDALVAHHKAAAMPGPTQAVGMYNAACAYALLGEPDKAFEWLEKCARAGYRDTAQVESDADLDSLRLDPRYQEILALMRGG